MALLATENLLNRPLAEISASSEAEGLGVRALLTPQLSDVYRSGPWMPGASVTISADLGEDRDCQLFLLAAPRDGVLPSAAAQVRVYAALAPLSNPLEAPFYSGFVPAAFGPNGLLAFVPPEPVRVRYVEWRFIAGAADRYLQLGRAWVAPLVISSRAAGYGQRRGVIDAGVNDRAGLSGVRYATPGARRRFTRWTYPQIPRADAEALDAAALEAGTTGQVFGSPWNADPARHGVLGHFSALPEPTRITPQRWSADIAIEEDL